MWSGEIFTPDDIAIQMLDLYPSKAWRSDVRFTITDIGCGDGNLLVHVVRRKIEIGYKPLEALGTTFGLDIVKNNVCMCRLRLLKACFAKTAKGNGELVFSPNDVTMESIRIVRKNIVEVDFDKFPKGSLDQGLVSEKYKSLFEVPFDEEAEKFMMKEIHRKGYWDHIPLFESDRQKLLAEANHAR